MVHRASTKLDVIGLTRELVQFNTINPPGREESCARYLAGLLEAGGLSVELTGFGPGRTNLVARTPSTSDRPRLCLTGHLDTVPLGASPWSCDPFGGEIKDGRVYGRGSCDMKGGVAAMVIAAIEVCRAGPAQAGLLLVLTGGEETGCDGAAQLARHGVAGPVGAIIVGEPTGNGVLLGHKGALWLEAIANGTTAHGSMPELGVNAIYKVARTALELERFDFGVPAHPIAGPPTLNVGTITGGLNINSVPDRAALTVDIRTIPGQAHSAVRQDLQSRLGPDVELRTLVDLPGVYTEPHGSWVENVFGIVADVTRRTQTRRTATYFTDASVLVPAFSNAPALIIGPGLPELAHAIDEYCEITRIEEAAAIHGRIASNWCLASSGFL